MYIKKRLLSQTPDIMLKTGLSKSSQSTPANVKKTFPIAWISLFDRNHKWEEKDEVQDAVHWFKQILSIIIGIIWGYFGFTGFIAIAGAAAVHLFGTYSLLNRVNYDFEPEEVVEIVKENFMQSFAAFLASWIVIYTAANFSHL